jgi:ADP-ribose pyrophosphatase YjhB (NUDIX family)
VVIVQDGQTLMMKDEGEDPSSMFWTPLAVRVEDGKDFEGSALAIIKETINQAIPQDQLQKVGQLNWAGENLESDPCANEDIKEMVYRVELSGQVDNSNVGDTKWFPINQLPRNQMLADQRLWVDAAVNDVGIFEGNFYFTKNAKTIQRFTFTLSKE